jgi:hypothetical protein
MRSESDQARSLAEKIARRITQDLPIARREQSEQSELTAELAKLRAGLAEMQRRLGQIEIKIRSSATDQSVSAAMENPGNLRTHSPWLQGVNATVFHPSQEKFGVEEAAVTDLVDFFQNERQCTMEPGGKPCDHCSMCSSRGF